MRIDLNNIQQHKDAIMEKVAIVPLKERMQICQNGLIQIIQEYSFLFDNDVEKTREVLLLMFLTEMKDDKFVFKKEEFLAAIPQKSKDDIFEKVFKKFLENAVVDDLKGKRED